MRKTLTSTFDYATKPPLLALYAVLFVGLSLLNWNIFAPVYGLIAGVSLPVANVLRGIFGFLTAVVGFAITAVAFVGIVKVVVEDTVDGHRLLATAASAAVDETQSGSGVEATEDGQAVDAN